MGPDSILASWTDVLTESKFVGNTLVQWLGLLGVLLGSFIVGKIVSFVLGRQGKRLEQREKVYLLAATLRSLAGPAGLLILAGGLYAASIFMNLTYIQIVTKEVVDEAGRTVTETDSQTKTLLPFWLNISRTIAVLAATWFIFKLVDVIEFFLKKWTSRTETTLDDQLVPLVRKTLRVFVVIVALLFIAQNIFEWNIGALVAGLGIGGLAFALAAKDMLANLFGSATIFADRPFAMGERVKIGEHDGLIEEVGFRSTRIRTLAGHLVTIPNATVANEMIENIGRRP
ncbi:MAG: mechanosensitive ion channel, partial [Phycisphaerae bacterium]|nr:mechanosensitive ion channel [Phycisphaerae bacterium]